MNAFKNLSFPHDRELLRIITLAHEANEKSDYLALCLTDTHQHAKYLVGKLKDATAWDIPDTKIFRHGIEVKGGGRVIVSEWSYPDLLHGTRPTKVVLFGRIGEMYYFLQSMGCPVEGVA